MIPWNGRTVYLLLFTCYRVVVVRRVSFPLVVMLSRRPCYSYSLASHFYIVVLGFTGVYITFFILLTACIVSAR